MHSAAKQLGAGRIIRQAVICRTPNSYRIDDTTEAWPVSELAARMT